MLEYRAYALPVDGDELFVQIFGYSEVVLGEISLGLLVYLLAGDVAGVEVGDYQGVAGGGQGND